MKKYTKLILSFFTFLSIPLAACNPPDTSNIVEKEKINYELNLSIANKIERNIEKIKTINIESEILNLAVKVNYSFNLNLQNELAKLKFKDYPLKESDIKNYITGFIDTIKNREIIESLTSKEINKLFESQLLNKQELNIKFKQSISGKSQYDRFPNFYKIIDSFSDFKQYLAYSKDLPLSKLTDDSNILSLKKLQADSLDNLIEFNGISENFFKDNLLLISGLAFYEEVININYDEHSQKLNLETLTIKNFPDSNNNYFATVNKLQEDKIEEPLPVQDLSSVIYRWSRQNEWLIVLNKQQLGIGEKIEDIEISETNLDNYDLLVEKYI
ncbi:hypothetical protein EI74_0231 [Mycoplasma testudineum]|uniref:Lipoprotein n=1 Tax=Mycoplasma testudineum TaxID=244584 RepID=A0A4R6IFR9_9MOLU|nr:hypothetical protein [Mycoplasma testudineum]OYD27045.1 hypothetical protein CG473_00120 [Mycoplasma testudineum]TDO21200.1 hypothetical protein EI74_0231 [Mycoplasma testudineum]